MLGYSITQLLNYYSIHFCLAFMFYFFHINNVNLIFRMDKKRYAPFILQTKNKLTIYYEEFNNVI